MEAPLRCAWERLSGLVVRLRWIGILIDLRGVGDSACGSTAWRIAARASRIEMKIVCQAVKGTVIVVECQNGVVTRQ